MTAPGYWLQVDVDDARPVTHYRNVYQGESVPDAMAAWSKAISDGAEYVMLEALQKPPREEPCPDKSPDTVTTTPDSPTTPGATRSPAR